ncbi:MAG: ATP-binding protein [Candidatus Protochlamydia sp.]|nr:ATP-binding protein [Candidatus Protochlamydia sp.]
MRRTAINFLQKWFSSDNRKPLVIRGARQVGKTWLVRHFAKETGKKLIEINLEKYPRLASSFSSNEPGIILKSLSYDFETTIDPSKSILFIDEIQAVPELFAKLRWFAEDMPELAVISAGSLLEFVLGKQEFSMPVGRISYMYLEPFSFEEFLLALQKPELIAQIKEFNWSEIITEFTHEKLMSLFKEYIIVGGMPAAVQSWVSKNSISDVSQIHNDILHTYRDDFGKYSGRVPSQRLQEVITAVPRNLGQKFVYTRINPNVRLPLIKEALDLLCQAKVCHRIVASSSNGVPLGAELLNHYFKVILLDVGLSSADLGLSLAELASIEELTLINKGGIAEQVVGQLLRTINPIYQEPALYYWVNSDKDSSAEIDYAIQHGSKVIPIEVKAGKTGTLKSLQRFMSLKGLNLAVRINSAPPSLVEVNLKDTQGEHVQYQLRSIPFYLIGELHRLLQSTSAL